MQPAHDTQLSIEPRRRNSSNRGTACLEASAGGAQKTGCGPWADCRSAVTDSPICALFGRSAGNRQTAQTFPVAAVRKTSGYSLTSWPATCDG